MNLSVLTLREKPHLIDEVVNCIWTLWSHEYISYTPIHTQEQLYRYYYKNIYNASLPIVYVLCFTTTTTKGKNVDTLVGFCCIDTVDCNVSPWLSPWLSNVYIKEEYRGKGYSSVLLNAVVPLYTPLHLWITTKKMMGFYERFGFTLLEETPKRGVEKEDVSLYVMKKECYKY
jgi:GNAT superfamily N-acetyltransferase